MLAELQLADWRRRMQQLYARIRALEPQAGWELWCAERHALFLEHSQSPLPADQRDEQHTPRYFAYDPAWRRRGAISAGDGQVVELPSSGEHVVMARRCGVVHIDGLPALSAFWLLDYAGGLFLSFRDAGAAIETYGGGRYLLDTAKGADLGGSGDTVIVDFNFAYQPSCSYDPSWSCPLPPVENRLPIAVAAGERLRNPGSPPPV